MSKANVTLMSGVVKATPAKEPMMINLVRCPVCSIKYNSTVNPDGCPQCIALALVAKAAKATKGKAVEAPKE